MACDISGSGCKVCPGMWIAGILLVVMFVQSWFARASVPPQTPSASTIERSELPNVQPNEEK